MKYLLLMCAALLSPAVAARASSKPSATGSWTGTAHQNEGSSNYTVNLTIEDDGSGKSDYPELKCGGTLSRVGASGEYAYYEERITRGRAGVDGNCIDGSVTIVLADGKPAAWSWAGLYRGKLFVAWSTLSAKP